jgi:DNA invertase Pin-like site-specific DNA recombinase
MLNTAQSGSPPSLLGGVECAANIQDCRKEAEMNRNSKITILYERLSREDSRTDQSLSIENQKKILEDYAVQNGFTPFLHLSDDGQTGTSWDRPAWQELIAMVEASEVSVILVKTMDRMGRDYLRMGLYREMFRDKGIRLIAVSDSFDSFLGEDDFTPFREIIAEWYARDTSKKVKAVLHSKGSSGKPLTNQAIYGYYKSPDDKNMWIVDDEAAKVIKRIFQMTVDGMGPTQIARQLSMEHIESPASYLNRVRKNSKAKTTEPYIWNGTTVARILTKQEYLGHTVNFRTTKPSFKSKKFKYNPKEDWVIFEDTHSAIIDLPTWDIVQKLRQTPRRSDTLGELNPLTGLMYCFDCGAKMYNSRWRKDYYEENRNGKVYQHKTSDFYTCSTNNRGYNSFKTICSGHYIRTEVVRNLVLEAIKAISGYVREHEIEFISKVREASAIRAEENAKSGKKKLAQNQKRIAELDRLFKKTYEDNAAGKLSDKRFEMLTAEYEKEQAELELENAKLQAAVDAFAADSERANNFIGIIKRHTEFDELSTAMLNEFVSKIIVHEADKSSGERFQEVEIIFNFIGRFTVPAEEKIQTEEELAAEEKRRAKLLRKREANRRWYAKKKAEQSAG